MERPPLTGPEINKEAHPPPPPPEKSLFDPEGRSFAGGDVDHAIDAILDKLKAKVGPVASVAEPWREKFKTNPVTVEEFCTKFVREPLWPAQLEMARAVWGDDPYVWRSPSPYDGETKNEVDCVWGKGGGKNKGVAKGIFAYGAYKLVNLKNPQNFLGRVDGDLIDLINVSFNSTQAKHVFFQQLKITMRKTNDPITGKNWFETVGRMDLHEGGKSFQGRILYLDDARTIRIHAGDSKEYTGEGLNILLALFDELGSFPSPAKALALMDALKDTSLSRYKLNALVAAISYVYAKNDAMQIRVAQAKKINSKSTFISEKSTFEANPTATKNDPGVAEVYMRNPERAKRVFEGIVTASDNLFFSMPEEVRGRCNFNRENPIKGDIWQTHDLAALEFKDWFKGSPAYDYHVRVDLAKGKDGRDKIGFAMQHAFKKRPSYSEDYMKRLAIEGVDAPEDLDERVAVFVDLMLQITAPPGMEAPFSRVIDFIIFLRDELGFNISLVTYDGWQSVGEIQRLREAGFTAEVMSVDKTPDAANLTKELMYSGLMDYYTHRTFLREAEELEDQDGKVDHPEMSKLRDVEENENKGSKDVWDAVAGNCQTLVAGIGGEGGGEGGYEIGWSSSANEEEKILSPREAAELRRQRPLGSDMFS